MRKNLTIFCLVALGLFWVGAAFAEFNANAYFKIDTDLATKGYQETQPKVTGIGATKQIGFAVYAQAWENAKGFAIKMEWDGAKATFRSASGTKITDDEITINGATLTPPAEDNILGTSLISAGETNTAGVYGISWAQQGGTAATTPTGLVYFAVLRTTDTFKTTDVLSVKVSLTVADETGAERFLGYRYFNVNQVAVKDASWGDVKNQFKNF